MTVGGLPARVRMRGIVRRFGAVTALDGADLEVRAGEVHGLLGENGAGKSTLLDVLGGLRAPDAGTIELEGRPVRLRSPRDAWAHGIGMVHQHFKLVPALSVLENLMLGTRTRGHGFLLPHRELRRRLEMLAVETELRVEPHRTVADLGVGARQRVEILKALLREPDVIVLDEPTAVLAPDEAGALFDLLRTLAARGAAVVLVAHKLDEVLAVADRVTVLRDGRTVRTAPREEVDAPTLVRAMLGGAPPEGVEAQVGGTGTRRPTRAPGGEQVEDGGRAGGPWRSTPARSPAGEVVARLERAGLGGEGPARPVEAVSLEVRRGEIVGIAGVEGNGQRELALLLAGRRHPDTGAAELPASIGFVPQDRTTEGLAQELDLTENVALAFHDRGRGPWMRWADLRRRTEGLIERFGVRAPGPATIAGALSGGNQQKLVVARELEVARDLLVAENPTRGLDVSAARAVHEALLALVRGLQEGDTAAPGVVLLSTDLDEVLALSDRVFAMTRGRLVAVPPNRCTRAGVGAAMLGVAP